jgi:hypothetical protein
LWEAFLLQMNDFDRYLETELRLMLDPVVVRRPPARKAQPEPATEPAPMPIAAEELAAEPIPVVAPVVILPVAPARSL